MSNKTPQLEDGYTRVSNELLDAIVSFNLSKREYKVLLCVIRKTYGFHKKTDDMTLTQIANTTGLNLAHVSKTVKEMSAKNILLKRQGKYGFIIGINKDYGQWKGLLKQQVAEIASEPYQNSNLDVPKQQSDVTETANTKENTKRNYQKKLPQENKNGSSSGDFIFSTKLIEAQINEIRTMLDEIYNPLAQQILDELDGALKGSKSPIKNPVGYCRALIKNAQENKFIPELGISIAAARNKDPIYSSPSEPRKPRFKPRYSLADKLKKIKGIEID